MNDLSLLDQVSAGIRGLEGVRALAFGICLLERATPAFFQFQRDTGWIGGGIVRAAVAQCWAVLEGESVEEVNFVSIAQCERAIPDSEGDFESNYTSAAIDAVDIACNLLLYVKNGDVDLIVNSVIAQIDTIELFLQNHESLHGPLGMPEDAHHDGGILKEELDFMRKDLEFVKTIDLNEKALFRLVLQRVLALDYRSLRLVLPRPSR